MDSRIDYSGMTTNERIFVAGRLADFDAAAHDRDRDKMIALLVSVGFPDAEAERITNTLMAQPEKYGY